MHSLPYGSVRVQSEHYWPHKFTAYIGISLWMLKIFARFFVCCFRSGWQIYFVVGQPSILSHRIQIGWASFAFIFCYFRSSQAEYTNGSAVCSASRTGWCGVAKFKCKKFGSVHVINVNNNFAAPKSKSVCVIEVYYSSFFPFWVEAFETCYQFMRNMRSIPATSTTSVFVMSWAESRWFLSAVLEHTFCTFSILLREYAHETEKSFKLT